MSAADPRKPVVLSDPDDLYDCTWADSTIFGTTSLVGHQAADSVYLDLPNLQMDESRLRLAASVFSNTNDGIMITDAKGVILDVNRAFTQTTGFSPEEVIGRDPGLLKSGIHPAAFYQELWGSLRLNGSWRGEIWNRRKDGELFVELMSISAVRDAHGELTHYVTIYTDITALKESQQRLEHLAYHDALTQLPNRVLLADRTQQALALLKRRPSLLAVCFIDLDHFKPINDTHGHSNGDRVLIEVAQRLKESVREGDTVARIGGDEFAMLLTDLESNEEARQILSRLLARVSQPYQIGNAVAKLSASIGYTLVPLDNSDSDSLLRHADQAMYAAKMEGRNRFHQFDTEQDQRVRSMRDNLTRVENALAAGECLLHYQPKVNMRRGTVIGAEALIRWQHPEQGLLSPKDFLLALGDHPLLIDIGDWAIRESLRQVAAWQSQGVRLPVSVNISANHLLHPEFVSRLTRYLNQYPTLDRRYLELEILETAVIDDIARVSRVISECRKLGVEFALDDFGTGYSSLLYLKQLPVRTLKIDQSFVRDMLDTSGGPDVVAGITGLATAFKRRVVAEGVETVEHGIILLRLRCDVGQGYGIARPMPADAIPGWLAAYKPDPAWQASLTLPWRRSDFPLLLAEVEQRRWLEQVIAAVERGDKALPGNRISNLREAHFGYWLFGIGETRYGELPELRKIEALHHNAHRISAEINQHLNKQELTEARQLLVLQRRHSQALVDGLNALRQAIVQLSEKPTAAILPKHSTFG